MLRDMLFQDGVFCCSEDANSEGEEGVFYLWPMETICEHLGDGAETFCQSYNVIQRGNYHDESTGILTGKISCT